MQTKNAEEQHISNFFLIQGLNGPVVFSETYCINGNGSGVLLNPPRLKDDIRLLLFLHLSSVVLDDKRQSYLAKLRATSNKPRQANDATAESYDPENPAPRYHT